ncbi:MAG: ferrous iron transport protein B, partial [Coriobacteriales bacterium]|nr:ferrous iron transport protein B [Coriobacteriales bacterium]
MKIALIGNPNSGKTTLFNELTGANQHVGNWPGVTVEKKEGPIRAAYGTGELVDLPGIYSLSPFSLEEIVSRDFIIDEMPDVVVDIVDATNLERNLYLSIQLIELNVPLVIALNMMDEVEKEGYQIDAKRLAHDLGVPVIPISAARKTGIKELVAELKWAHLPKRHELPNPHLERLIALTEALLNEHIAKEHRLGDDIAEGYPLHWAAIKVLESDELVLRHLTLDPATSARIDELKTAFENEHSLLCTAFADARYKLIHHMIYHGVTVWSKDGKRHKHLEHAHEDYHHTGYAAVPSVEETGAEHEDAEKGAVPLRQMSHVSAQPAPVVPQAPGQAPSAPGPGQAPGQAPSAPAPGQAPGQAPSAPGQAPGQAPSRPLPPHAKHTMSNTSDRLDRVLTHRIWSIPLFLLVMFAVFHLTFSEDLLGLGSLFGIEPIPSPGVWLQTLTEVGIAWFSNTVATLFEPGSWSESLVVGGIIGGVGSVLSFVPKILLLFLFLTLLEDCGYMARAAFIMDRLFKKVGLSGKSFLPMLMGFGCTVPAAMACRTMENEQDRRLTLLLVPFMSCGARAPIFLVFAGAFFTAYADLLVLGLYALGIVVALVSGIILKKILFKGAYTPFIIELPRYRAPRPRSVALTLWDKFKGYLVRAGTIIFAMCVVVWFFSSFGLTGDGFGLVDIEQSLLATAGNLIAPVFSPLGFGFWTAAVAVLTGFIAKESVVGTLGVLFGIGEDSPIDGGGLTTAGLT